MSSAPVARRLGIEAWFGLAAGFGEALSWIIRRPLRGELTAAILPMLRETLGAARQ